MSEFSNNFFRDLPPRERRYDVPVVDELVFCVFPNGVKTWVHVYPFEEFTRRRTIGLYPDMRFEQVRDALDASRTIVELDSDHEKRRVQEVRRNRGFRTVSMTILAAAAGVAVSVLVARTLQGEVAFTQAPRSAPAPVPGPRDPDPVADQTNPIAILTIDPTEPEAQLPHQDPVVSQPLTPDTTGEETSPTVPDTLADRVDPITTPEKESTQPAIGQTEKNQLIAQAEMPEIAGDEASHHKPDPVASADDEEPHVDSAGAAGPAVAVVESTPEAQAGPETIVTRDTQPASEKVRRALLTDGIDAHEPTNALQDPIEIDAQDLRTIFFFTELRGLGGERISHHWKYQGNIVAAMPFDVGADGRWRVYSSKRISADQSGNWTVEVVNSEDVVLSDVAFEVVTSAAN